MRSSNTPLPQSFLAKKKVILDQLSVPISEYDDLSPKGSIDVDIRDLIDEINQLEGCVTTSSCSGRVSVFLEGMKQAGREGLDDDVGEENEKAKEKARQDEPQGFGDDSGFRKTTVGVGGKGGGTWLYVSHSEVDISQYGSAGDLLRLLGMDDLHDGLPPSGRTRFIHFKFEPMILHVLTASFEQAQIVVSAALQAGFRESGAINLTASTKEPPTPMVAVRSMGLALESLVGFYADGRQMCSVSEVSLRTLLEISNDRFRANAARIRRFRELLIQLTSDEAGPKRRDGTEEWEDAEDRKERKRAEGLRRKEMLKDTKEHPIVEPDDIAGLKFFP